MSSIFSGSLGEYAASKETEMATLRLEEPSVGCPGRINVLIQAGTFEACQAIVMQVMEDVGSATFTIPVKAHDGQFLAVGHYQKSDKEPLPEF